MENVSIETFLQWRRDIKGNEMGYACRLLLDFGIQATGKTKNIHDFVCVK